MKRLYTALLASALILAGCAKSEIPSPTSRITIMANAEAPVSTKAAVTDEGVVGWSEGDQIGAFDTRGNRLYALTYAPTTEKAFYGQVSGSPDFRIAIYPYNQNGTVTADTYNVTLPSQYESYVPGTSKAPMVAGAPTKDDNGDHIFSFKHMTALVKVTYSHVPIGTQHFHIKAENNIAGTVSDLSTSLDDGAQLDSRAMGGDTSDEVTFALSSAVTSAGQTMSFYVPVPVARYSYFQVKLTDSEDTTIWGTAKKVSIPTDEQSFRRAELHILPAIDLSTVDLGLSVKWASCNLGAAAPQEYGNYYAWGDTEAGSGGSWEAYKWSAANNEQHLTKYVFEGSAYGIQVSDMYGHEGFLDHKSVLEKEDDAASMALGDNWRMPTHDEWEELCESCTWTWTTLDGTEGYKVTGSNGNSIFLPKTSTDQYSDDCYWSSSLVTDTCYQAYATGFPADTTGTPTGVPNCDYTTSRYCGLTIRPVLGN